MTSERSHEEQLFKRMIWHCILTFVYVVVAVAALVLPELLDSELSGLGATGLIALEIGFILTAANSALLALLDMVQTCKLLNENLDLRGLRSRVRPRCSPARIVLYVAWKLLIPTAVAGLLLVVLGVAGVSYIAPFMMGIILTVGVGLVILGTVLAWSLRTRGRGRQVVQRHTEMRVMRFGLYANIIVVVYTAGSVVGIIWYERGVNVFIWVLKL
jgi:hypothetical protein